MHRVIVGSLLAVLLSSATFALGAMIGKAQEGSSALTTACSSATRTSPPVIGTDVTFELIAQGDPEGTDLRTLGLTKFTFEPNGPGVPNACYLEPVLVSVLSGRLTISVFEGTVEVSRGGEIGTQAPRLVSGSETGSAATLEPGDSLFVEVATYGLQNEGKDDAVVLVSTLTFDDAGCPCATWPT